MPYLHVNIDHVATVRQARRGSEPDPVTVAPICEMAGAMGITVHLREDRRHIQDRDVRLLREIVQTKLNLEMAATPEMVENTLAIKPDIATIVPEKREEITTEGGLDVLNAPNILNEAVLRLSAAGIRVSLFIDPDREQIEAAKHLGVTDIELHTGSYANATDELTVREELERLNSAARIAAELGLQLNAGHGLNYHNIQPVARLPKLCELNIGHSIVSRALYVGFEKAVRQMVDLINNPS